jgi:hypothetical protein
VIVLSSVMLSRSRRRICASGTPWHPLTSACALISVVEGHPEQDAGTVRSAAGGPSGASDQTHIPWHAMSIR